MDIPRKINERPTIWLGLTLGELTRMGLSVYLVASLILTPLLSITLGFKGVIFALLLSFLIAMGGVYIWGKAASKKKEGKPYGYSDQLFAIRLSRLGLNFSKFPGVTRQGIWFHKRSRRR